MSQVRSKATCKGRPVVVMAGWDRPLHGFFLTVFEDEDEDEDERPVYCNLDDPELRANLGFAPDTLHFEAKLKELGIEVPEGFWERVHRREGNALYFHDGERWDG